MNEAAITAKITLLENRIDLLESKLDTGGEFVNVKQACNLLGISDTTFRKYRKLYPHIFPTAHGCKYQPRYRRNTVLSFWKKVGKHTTAERSNPNKHFLNNQIVKEPLYNNINKMDVNYKGEEKL
jgi:hypothetical protein